jgi:PAS domain S-box-containing protein
MEKLDSAAFRLAAIVESSDDAIISQTLNGTIETWNRAAERLFGYTAGEAIGRHIDLIIPPDRRVEDQQLTACVSRGEGLSHLETIRVTKAGTTVPVSLTISPVRTPEGRIIGISRIVRDISRQKSFERDALRLAAIVDSSEDAIASKDLNGIVQTWNKAAERMFGYTAEEIVGQSIMLIIPPDRQAEENDVLARIRSGVSIHHFETVRRRKDGSPLEISLSVSPIMAPDGTIVGASKIARDVTMQRRLARAAEEANRVKDEFLATLSHELRTPLNAVLGYTRMLRMGHFEGRADRVVQIIERNANLLLQLVSDVLDVSSIVTGKVRLQLAPCDLVLIVGAAIDSVRPSAEAKGVALRLETTGAALRAHCDRDRLQQVVWNLLSNAVKFTPPGGHVEVRLAAEDSTAKLTVRDTGAGIRADWLPYVFQRFWQGEDAEGPQTGGLGLGLALARHFVELHGGTIKADSPGEGQGATFTVRLPLSRDE